MYAQERAEEARAEETPLLEAELGADLADKSYKEVPLGHLISLTMLPFPISLIWASMGMVVLPAEALRLHPDNEAWYLGIMLFVVAVSQLVCPVAGHLSDRCRSSWGKRRPYIVLGTVLVLLSSTGLWCFSIFRIPSLFLVCLFLSQAGLNVAYTAQASIVPDTCKHYMGTSSGIVACWQLAGNFVGMLWIILTYQTDYHYSYGFQMMMLSLAVLVVCHQMKERPTDADPENPFSWSRLLASFKIDMEHNRDFFFVFIGRMLFYIAMSCQAFSYYYFRDMLQIENKFLIRKQLAGLMLLGTFVGMWASYPLGKASDNPKVGRKRMIYLACACMATVFIGNMLVPIIFSPTVATLAIYPLGCLYGIGVAGYTSVDYALALDCLPGSEEKGSSEALGLWGIAGFVGSSAGPLLGGALLEMNRSPDGSGYLYRGYVLMISMGVLSFLGCATVTSFIRKVD